MYDIYLMSRSFLSHLLQPITRSECGGEENKHRYRQGGEARLGPRAMEKSRIETT